MARIWPSYFPEMVLGRPFRPLPNKLALPITSREFATLGLGATVDQGDTGSYFTSTPLARELHRTAAHVGVVGVQAGPSVQAVVPSAVVNACAQQRSIRSSLYCSRFRFGTSKFNCHNLWFSLLHSSNPGKRLWDTLPFLSNFWLVCSLSPPPLPPPRQLRLSSPARKSKSTLPTEFKKYPQPFKERCISEVIRIGSIIIFPVSKLWKAKFFILCGVIFLVSPQGKFVIDHSWEWKVWNVRSHVLPCQLLGQRQWKPLWLWACRQVPPFAHGFGKHESFPGDNRSGSERQSLPLSLPSSKTTFFQPSKRAMYY